jgi:hypothetical protein
MLTILKEAINVGLKLCSTSVTRTFNLPSSHFILMKVKGQIENTCQGLKNLLVRGPGLAICGFGPNIFYSCKDRRTKVKWLICLHFIIVSISCTSENDESHFDVSTYFLFFIGMLYVYQSNVGFFIIFWINRLILKYLYILIKLQMFIYIYVYVIFNNDLKPKEALWRKISTYFIMNIFLQIDDTLQIMEIYYLCSSPKPGSGFPTSYVMVFAVFSELRSMWHWWNCWPSLYKFPFHNIFPLFARYRLFAEKCS